MEMTVIWTNSTWCFIPADLSELADWLRSCVYIRTAWRDWSPSELAPWCPHQWERCVGARRRSPLTSCTLRSSRAGPRGSNTSSRKVSAFQHLYLQHHGTIDAAIMLLMKNGISWLLYIFLHPTRCLCGIKPFSFHTFFICLQFPPIFFVFSTRLVFPSSMSSPIEPFSYLRFIEALVISNVFLTEMLCQILPIPEWRTVDLILSGGLHG